jgi:hypothetical protein
MNQVMLGAVAMGFLTASLFFLRFWRETRDRLFALFALSFFVLAVNRAGIGLVAGSGGTGDYLYWVRLLAFVLILAAILDKNRSREPPEASRLRSDGVNH